jgi:hypothetical protein
MTRKNKPGAGRPQKYGEPLVRIRVPVGLLEEVKRMCEAYRGKNKTIDGLRE